MHKIYAISSLYVDEMKLLDAQQTTVLQDLSAKSAWESSDRYQEQQAKPYQTINGIALYSIHGKMLSKRNFFTMMFGMTTYDDIAESLSMMAQDESVEKVLISMSTPGGNVAGISDLSDAWSRLNAIKPITVHTPATLASAGIWLASNSSEIYASETADIGSIGVILHHESHQEELHQMGIKITEIKSAPLKAVGSSARDLTDEERQHLQAAVDEADGLFKKQLFNTRPQIKPEAFTGATFSASMSLKLGLIDGIKTFTSVFEQLSASADSQPKNSYKGEYGMKKKVTAAMAEAAISAGADPLSFEIVSQEIFDGLTPETNEPKPEGKVEGEELEVQASEVELALNAQVEALGVELAGALAQVETLKAEVSSLTESSKLFASEPLRVIAEERLATMRIAMGLSKVDLSAFATSSIVTEYNALKPQFEARYIPGGHVTPAVPPKADGVEIKSSTDAARNRAAGF